MALTYLEQDSQRANKKKIKMFTAALVFFIVVAGGLCFALKDSFNMQDEKDQKMLYLLIGLAALMLFFVIVGLIGSIRIAKNGKNLILPFDGESKEAVAKRIDQEAAEGQLLVDEYMGDFSNGGKPSGEKVTLTPTYLLLNNGLGKIKVIPRSKIYWLCAQVGIKGRSSFVVRLLVFTETKTFYLDGVDVPHVEAIAEKLYQHIPNIFSGIDPFPFSYEMEELFAKDRAGFVRLCESEKNKAHAEETE